MPTSLKGRNSAKPTSEGEVRIINSLFTEHQLVVFSEASDIVVMGPYILASSG